MATQIPIMEKNGNERMMPFEITEYFGFTVDGFEVNVKDKVGSVP